jgi:ABC-type phosphate transport system substrate-binding protein
MSRFSRRRAVTGGLVACAALASASTSAPPATAASNPDCSTLPNPVYGAGGSAQVPLLKQLATQLAGLSTPTTIIYQSSGGACVGYGNLATPTPITGTANYWDSTGTQLTCNLSVAGDPVVFAVMGNSAAACSGGAVSGFVDVQGPAQSYDFIVPIASSQTSISAEAAYYVYGFGASDAAHSVSPWTQPAEIIKRNASSGATIAVGTAIGVPAAKFQGVDGLSNTGVVSDVANAANPENAIGYVSGEVADGNRSTVRVLAYQHTGQTCGYWPDSTKDKFDKINVRTGQYWIWSPVHFFAAGSGTTITDPNAAKLIGYFSGAVAPPAGVDIFSAEVKASTVPKCAMQAWRTSDITSAPYSYADPQPCDCKFEALATGSTSCTPCPNGNSDCAATPSTPTCRYGYCEAN